MGEGLAPGLSHQVSVTVLPDMLASRYASGTPEAFATPALVGLIERTAAELVAEHLTDAETTVGTAMTLRHLAATPAGMQVRCAVRLTEVDRRRLVFSVEAWDEFDRICEATHERFIVNRLSFASKLNEKATRARPEST